MRRGVVIFLIFCFSTIQYVSSQNQQQLIFTSKKDTSEIKTFILPTVGKIRTNDLQNYYVRIIEVRDNQIIGLKNILSDSVMSDKNTQLLKQLEETGYRISHDKSLKKKERYRKLDSLGLCYYADTVAIENSEISKIVLSVEYPSRLLKTIIVAWYLTSFAALMTGSICFINDSVGNTASQIKTEGAFIALGGLIGCIGTLTLSHYLTHNHFNLEKWEMKIEDQPFINSD
ncbi:hypothetical protein DSECCO2_473930 [anaerobic digester metagenome]